MQDATTIPAHTHSGASLVQRLKAAFELRNLSIIAVVATYGLIVLGGTVRVTDSGTACPDWPLCHGQIIPPADTKVWIEFTHRLVASIVGFIILGVVFLIWRKHRQNKLLIGAGVATVALLALQVIVGGITVGTETAPGVVAVHLTIALTLLSLLILMAVAVRDPLRAAAGPVRGMVARMPALTLMAMSALFALIIVGAFVSQMDAGLAYPDWPLFDGNVTPSGSESGNIHYAHRLLAVFAGAVLLLLAIRALRVETNPVVLLALAVGAVLFMTQVLIGAANVWADLATSVRILHLALASALWGVLVFALTWSHARSREAGA